MAKSDEVQVQLIKVEKYLEIKKKILKKVSGVENEWNRSSHSIG